MSKLMHLGAFLVAAVVGLGAQDPVPSIPAARPATPAPTFRTGTSIVAVNVTVTDGPKLVTGLDAADFELYEDGVRQDVRFFAATSAPLDLVLLIDASSSMGARMPEVHEAARSFMRVLRPGDRGAIVAFSNSVRVVQGLTDDRAAIERAINSIDARGDTGLHTAIYISLKQFGRTAIGASDLRRQAIAVLSDGDDTSSLVSGEDVLQLARKTGVSVYTIGLRWLPSVATGDRRDVSSGDYFLRTLARETGARAFFPLGPGELTAVYGAIGRELEAQYSLAYAPSDPRADGRFRRIEVRVTTDPSFRSRTRSGYVAEPVRPPGYHPAPIR